MSPQHSTDRIITTHVGSLPRPAALLDLMQARAGGQNDPAAWNAAVSAAVKDCVRRQIDAGIDVPCDGEQSKTGFFAYVRERLEGFAVMPGPRPSSFGAEVAAFPEYYAEYFKRAMTGASAVPALNLVCNGPVRYVGLDALQRDIDNLKAALTGLPHRAAFMPAVAPSGVGGFGYYKTEEEFFHAVGAALAAEYRAIVDAGLLLQIDDPFLSEVFADPAYTPTERERRASIYVEAVNASLAGIPPEKVRYHTCYGINEGPRIHEADLGQVVGHMLRVDAGAYSFEAANARHEHEYHLWERVKLPAGKVLIPGVITHASNIVEHPELIAERLVRYAERIGRENVVAGADCGFSSQATYHTEVHPTVIWAKFQAMRDGARIASKKLWS
jgi:5-methyltetrahydropteroyltriglutamate--homocysteine methyltransferase